MAVENDHLDIVKYLIDNGARTDILTSNSNRSAEQYSVSEEMRHLFEEYRMRESFKMKQRSFSSFSNKAGWERNQWESNIKPTWEPQWNQNISPPLSTSSSWPTRGFQSENTHQQKSNYSEKRVENRRSPSVNGEVEDAQAVKSASPQSKKSPTKKQSPQSSPVAPVASTPFSSKITQLTTLKELAVKEERYSDAQVYKDKVDELRRCEGEIRQLEDIKREAIKREKFMEAQKIKDKIDEIIKTAFESKALASKPAPLPQQPHQPTSEAKPSVEKDKEQVRLPPL
jgi:hypothetical protein